MKFAGKRAQRSGYVTRICSAYGLRHRIGKHCDIP
jgi:hypothetical protein